MKPTPIANMLDHGVITPERGFNHDVGMQRSINAYLTDLHKDLFVRPVSVYSNTQGRTNSRAWHHDGFDTSTELFAILISGHGVGTLFLTPYGAWQITPGHLYTYPPRTLHRAPDILPDVRRRLFRTTLHTHSTTLHTHNENESYVMPHWPFNPEFVGG